MALKIGQEIVSIARQGWDNTVSNPDRILEENNGRVDGELLGVYDKILRADAHLYSLFQTRKHMILGKSFEIHSASEDKKDIEIADFVKYQLNDVLDDFTQDMHELLSCLQYGYSVSEFILSANNNRIMIDKIKFKHPNHFAFSEQGELLWNKENSAEKIILPSYKFIVHSHNANDENLYGESLISERLYWLYWYKHNIWQFLVSFIERFGSPIPVFKYPTSTTEEEHRIIDEMMHNFHDQLAMKVPTEVMPELLEWKSSGNRAVHEDAVKLINSEMSKAVLGQTLTSETQDTGSLAQSKVHENILDNIIKFDCMSLANTINNQLIKRLVAWNFKTDKYPFLKFKTEPDTDLKALAERDEILIRMGVKIPQAYFHETYNVPVEEENKDKKEKKDKESKLDKEEDIDEHEGLKSFSEKELNEDELVLSQQNELDRYIDIAVGKAVNAQEQFNIKLKKLIKKRESFKSLKSFVKKLFSKTDSSLEDSIYREDIEPLAEVLGDIMFWVYNLGHAHALDYESIIDFAEEDISFPEAINHFKNKVPKTHDEFLTERDKLGDKAFYISRVNNKKVVEGVHERIAKGIKEGKSFYNMKKDINTYFDKLGVTRLNSYHLDTVIRTNVLSAYSAGRLKQISTPEARKAFPYWRYSAIMDRKVRPAHRKLHGLVLRNDDPRWANIYPPSGFNCRCTVTTVRQGYFKQKGLPEPKKGELSFSYHNKDALAKVPIENPKGLIRKGKGGWNSQIIKEKDFDFPQRDKGFKSSKNVFGIDKNIHGDPKGFGLAQSKKTKYTRLKHVKIDSSNGVEKALIDLDSHVKNNYPASIFKTYKKLKLEVPKGINTNSKELKLLFNAVEKVLAIVKHINKNILESLSSIRFIPERIGNYKHNILKSSINGLYENNSILLFRRLMETKDVKEAHFMGTLRHELGHHAHFLSLGLLPKMTYEQGELFAQAMDDYFLGKLNISKGYFNKLKRELNMTDKEMNEVFKRLKLKFN